MENVSAHVSGMVLHLPAGPRFRVEKEIKNVVTSIAKTCHYWAEHMPVAQHRSIADLFEIMDEELPLIQVALSTFELKGAETETLRDSVAEGIQVSTGLAAPGREYFGWLGVDCLEVRSAIFMMRMMAVSNVLCRRENNFIYIPVDPSTENYRDSIVGLVARAHRVAKAQGLITSG
jgi:sirohydrochlorin cobaltochelatase